MILCRCLGIDGSSPCDQEATMDGLCGQCRHPDGRSCTEMKDIPAKPYPSHAETAP